MARMLTFLAINPDAPFIDEVSTEDGPVAVRAASKDAYQVCLLSELVIDILTIFVGFR